jgi:hypothetical protein
MYRVQYYTVVRATSYKTVPPQHSLPPGVFARLQIFVLSKQAILWLPVQMTLLHSLLSSAVLNISCRCF